MAKAQGKRGGERKKAAPTKNLTLAAPKRPAEGWRIWARGVGVGLAVAVLYAIWAGYIMLVPVVVLPLLTGVLIGLVMGDLIPAAIVGTGAAILGSILAGNIYKPATFVATVNHAPNWMSPDIITQAFQSLFGLVTANQLNTAFAGGRFVWFVVIAAVVSAGAAVAAAYIGRSAMNSRLLQWSVLAIACVCMLQSTYLGSATLRQQIATQPPSGTYGYDAMFNVRTYYLMRDGMGLYPAYLYSMAKDSRYISQNLWADGKMPKGSASLLREPLVFAMWRVVGFRSPDAIVWFSMLCAAAVMVLGYWAFRERLGATALLIPFVLAPGMMFHAMWLNIFFPDWWAALAFMASAFALSNGWWKTSAGLGVLACLFREVFCIWLAVVALVAWVRFVRNRRELVPAISFSVALVVSVAAYLLHVWVGDHYFVQVINPGGSVFTALRDLSVTPLTHKTWPAIYYLMTPYLMTIVSPLVLLVLGVGGYALVGESRFSRAALAGYIVVTLAMWFTIGAHSSYWGQDVTLFGVAGTAVLVGRGLVALMPADMKPAEAPSLGPEAQPS